MEKVIKYLFYLLFFTIPLIFLPWTSELFEFNKMVATYIFTILIVAAWAIRMIAEKRIIFRRTSLEFFLVGYLATQLLSYFVSIDRHTSFFGYYSRFHGGLLSSISYALLYWAYVSNMDKNRVVKTISIILTSSVFVSIYAVLQHLGIDKDIWVQDVQNRVFSTLGQPNWLAAWITALVPFTWSFALNFKYRSSNFKLKSYYFLWLGLSALFFLILLYTKSRSGILGLLVADIFVWSSVTFINIKSKLSNKKLLETFVICHLSFVILAFLSGTPWTPNLSRLVNKNSLPSTNDQSPTTNFAPALEIGGSPSVKIRQIVWRGAVDIWKAYPVFGSGVETFAFSYYKFKPQEHNLVSEWDFLYNKAHNEYLNFAATTGTVGVLSYLILIISTIIILAKKSLISNAKLRMTNQAQKIILKNQNNLIFDIWNIAFLAGYFSILITNFFGFSVVPVALLFFLYPAMAISLGQEGEKVKEQENNFKPSNLQRLAHLIVILFTLLLFYHIGKYWYSDYLYSLGKSYSQAGEISLAQNFLTKAVKLSPKEAIYASELSQVYSSTALVSIDNDDLNLAQNY